MSKIIASAAIRGAGKIFAQAEGKYRQALEKYGPEQEIGFPNTAYYLPIIYSMTGIAVARVKDMERVLDVCRRLIPPPVRQTTPLPYLAPALDAGMATFFAEEMIEAVRYLEEPDRYAADSEETTETTAWLGAANDVIFRKRGVEFVDGTAPGSRPSSARRPMRPRRRGSPLNCRKRTSTCSCADTTEGNGLLSSLARPVSR
jgi:acetyl-CoA synthase